MDTALQIQDMRMQDMMRLAMAIKQDPQPLYRLRDHHARCAHRAPRAQADLPQDMTVGADTLVIEERLKSDPGLVSHLTIISVCSDS